MSRPFGPFIPPGPAQGRPLGQPLGRAPAQSMHSLRPAPFKSPTMVTPRPTPKPAWKAPQQSSNPIPSRQTEKEQLAKEREAKERAAQEERKRKELEVRKQFNDYEDTFDNVERMLSLDNANDKEMLEQFSRVHNMTIEMYKKYKDRGLQKDEESGKMDAFGTQLWNISVHMMQTAGDSLTPEQRKLIADIRCVAVMQLELGAPRPWDSATCTRLVTAQIQTALFCSSINIAAAQTVLQSCKEILEHLGIMDDEDSKALAAEGMTSYFCASYVWAELAASGTPQYQLEKAIKCCKKLTPNNWAYNETIHHCIDCAQKAYQKACTVVQDKGDPTGHFKEAANFFQSAVTLMEQDGQYWNSCINARKILAICHYELAQLNNDAAANYVKAHDILQERESSLVGVSEKSALAQSILLRLEILEEMQEGAEKMLTTWKLFVSIGELKLEDITRINRLLAKREDERLLEGDYIFQVAKLVIDVIKKHQDGEHQRMVGKILLFLIEATSTRTDLHKFTELLDHVSASGFILSQPVALSCQTALFATGERFNNPGLFETAGHPAFSAERANTVRAIRKAAWVYIEQGEYDQASRVLTKAPIEENEGCLTFLTCCILHIKQKDEILALQSLKSIVEPTDGSLVDDKAEELLPMIIKEAQQAKMKNVSTEALFWLAKLIDPMEASSNQSVAVILHTVISIQLEGATRDRGLTTETITALADPLNLCIQVVEIASQQDVDNNTTADIATWLYKTLYNIASSDVHCIDPDTCQQLIQCALMLFVHRQRFSQPLDTESYRVALWAHLHLLTAHATKAKKVEERSEEEYHQAWSQVVNPARDSLLAFQEAITHNAGSTESFGGADTAIEIVLADAMVKLKMWNEIAALAHEREQVMSIHAIEAITDMVCKVEETSYDLRTGLIMNVIGKLHSLGTATTSDIHKSCSWMQKMMQLELEQNTPESTKHLLENFQNLCNMMLQDEAVRRKWPRDQLQWMSLTSWDLGSKLANAGDGDILALPFLETGIQLADLDGRSAATADVMRQQLAAWTGNHAA